MRKFLLLLMFAFASLAVAVPVVAQESASIVQARRAGLIGERFDGYLGFVTPNPPAELHRQVNAINIRRRSLYHDLAARKGVTPEEVGITAACSLLRRIGIGEYYLSGQGSWQRYAAGQSPVPAYCG
jgi:uncharacterized protein YdbL (DUF1318 family)